MAVMDSVDISMYIVFIILYSNGFKTWQCIKGIFRIFKRISGFYEFEKSRRNCIVLFVFSSFPWIVSSIQFNKINTGKIFERVPVVEATNYFLSNPHKFIACTVHYNDFLTTFELNNCLQFDLLFGTFDTNNYLRNLNIVWFVYTIFV